MSKNNYFYSIDGDFFEVETIWDIEDEPEHVAEDAAEDFHANHDGWERSWPIDITLHHVEDGDAIATCSVELEHQPSFSAAEID